MTMAPGPSMSGDSYWDRVEGKSPASPGVERIYYIGADEVVWDYAPHGMNDITGRAFDSKARLYTARGPGRIGSKNLKCLYRAYSDGSFKSLLERSPDEAYLGYLGPIIRAEVGDTIKVIYRNGCRIPTSVHAHGVFYAKSSEGAPYADGTSGNDKLDDAVTQGTIRTYLWSVPERAGPGPHDGSSVMWMYHSHADEIGDAYAGLMGAMVITAKGMARPDGSPIDVDQELFEVFTVVNENLSPYLEANVKSFEGTPRAPLEDPEFQESNLKHSINGFVFGNQPMVNLVRGRRTRWYVMSMGNEIDLHTPHWHGNTVLVGGMRMDVVSLLPASMVVADMVPDNAGIWLFHCHVSDHYAAGMISRYAVVLH